MFKTIALESVEKDMILDKPILNNFGQVLLGAGVTLEEKHIRLLKTWNIAFIDIEDATTPDEDGGISDELIVAAMQEIKLRMDWQPRHPLEENLFQMGVLTLAESKMKSNA